jgi:hypothetical protein
MDPFNHTASLSEPKIKRLRRHKHRTTHKNDASTRRNSVENQPAQIHIQIQHVTENELPSSSKYKIKKQEEKSEDLTTQGHVYVDRFNSNDHSISERNKKDEYLTAQGHIHVDSFLSNDHSISERKKKDEYLTSKDHIHVDSFPSNDRSISKRKKKDEYLTSQGHIHVDSFPSNDHSISERKKKDEYLTSQGHIHVDSFPSNDHSISERKKKDEYLTSQGHIHVDSFPSNDHSISKRKKKDEYLTSQGHIHVDSFPSNDHSTSERKKKDEYLTSQGHIHVDLFQSNDSVTKRSKQDNVPINQEKKQHIDASMAVACVSQTETKSVPYYKAEKRRKKNEYLSAEGHVTINRPKDIDFLSFENSQIIDSIDEGENQCIKTNADLTHINQNELPSGPDYKLKKQKQRNKCVITEDHVNVNHLKANSFFSDQKNDYNDIVKRENTQPARIYVSSHQLKKLKLQPTSSNIDIVQENRSERETSIDDSESVRSDIAKETQSVQNTSSADTRFLSVSLLF